MRPVAHTIQDAPKAAGKLHVVLQPAMQIGPAGLDRWPAAAPIYESWKGGEAPKNASGPFGLGQSLVVPAGPGLLVAFLVLSAAPRAPIRPERLEAALVRTTAFLTLPAARLGDRSIQVWVSPPDFGAEWKDSLARVAHWFDQRPYELNVAVPKAERAP